jgi:hypothetical protein
MNRDLYALCLIAAAALRPAFAADPPASVRPAPAVPAVPAAPAASAATDAASAEPAVQTSSAAVAPAARAGPAAPRKGAAGAHGKDGARDSIDLEATQITGNHELPNVMYVVPWKKPDLGDFAGRPPKSLLDEMLAPVDREVFQRQNRYFAALQPDSAAGGARSGAAPVAPGAPPAAPAVPGNGPVSAPVSGDEK